MTCFRTVNGIDLRDDDEVFPFFAAWSGVVVRVCLVDDGSRRQNASAVQQKETKQTRERVERLAHRLLRRLEVFSRSFSLIMVRSERFVIYYKVWECSRR